MRALQQQSADEKTTGDNNDDGNNTDDAEDTDCNTLDAVDQQQQSTSGDSCPAKRKRRRPKGSTKRKKTHNKEKAIVEAARRLSTAQAKVKAGDISLGKPRSRVQNKLLDDIIIDVKEEFGIDQSLYLAPQTTHNRTRKGGDFGKEEPITDGSN